MGQSSPKLKNQMIQQDTLHLPHYPEYIESSGDVPDTLSEKQPEEKAAIQKLPKAQNKWTKATTSQSNKVKGPPIGVV